MSLYHLFENISIKYFNIKAVWNKQFFYTVFNKIGVTILLCSLKITLSPMLI